MDIDLDQFRAEPGKKVHLDEIDPSGTGKYQGQKSQAKEQMVKITQQLNDLQERMYAVHQHAILIVLQGMDTSGKDGTIEHVFAGINPQGVRVANFKAPTPEELGHDFLWRIHKQTPGKGEMVIFNRSHYEDVLVVRVHDLVPEKTWRKRYQHINHFERLLTDEGTLILKFFLYISPEEQKQRLLDRLNQPEKNWKFNPGDLQERDLWPQYIQAYEDAIGETSTKWAPWFIVPADHKWFRDLFIASALLETLKALHPEPVSAISEEDIQKYKAELEEE